MLTAIHPIKQHERFIDFVILAYRRGSVHPLSLIFDVQVEAAGGHFRHVVHTSHIAKFAFQSDTFGIGFEENQNHIIRKEGFHVHQFFLCTAGKGKLIFKDKEYQIKPGDFYFLPAHIPHEYYGLDEPWKVWWIAFYADDNLLLSSGCKEFFILSSQKISSFDSYYYRIATVLKNETDSGKFQASVILYQMISEIYSSFH